MKSSKPHSVTCGCHGTDGKPLSRDEFREKGLERDNHQCIFCGSTEKLSVHHIIERRLFSDCFGYHEANAATVCDPCHLKCEQTVISCDQVRDQVGIQKTVLPEYMYPDHQYDKWGNIILLNGKRMPGPLFYDESVQKVLSDGGVLSEFTPYYKYPRSYHHPLSAHKTEDDKTNYNISHHLISDEIVITIKMDGENFAGYPDYCHARSIDSLDHESRAWAKNYHYQNVAYNLPEGMRYYAENLYAKHAIHYQDLESYLYGFQIWDKDICLSWDDTKEWFELLGMTMVQEVYRGPYDEVVINDLFKQAIKNGHEGVVVRTTKSFHYSEFRNKLCKLVRPNHIADGSNHWRFKKVVLNELKKR